MPGKMARTPEMRHESPVSVRRGQSQSKGTADLTEAAGVALAEGRFERALKLYRELEWLEDENPTWSLRVADCYRRLAQRESEVLALSRAAGRYEQRGFTREAVALWTRVQTLDPRHPTAPAALTRLGSGAAFGLERLRSSMPAALASHITPVVDRAPRAVDVPAVPRPPGVPVFDEATLAAAAVGDGALVTAASALASGTLALAAPALASGVLAPAAPALASGVPAPAVPAAVGRSALTCEAELVPLRALPIYAVGGEADTAEVEFLEADVHPSLAEIDDDW